MDVRSKTSDKSKFPKDALIQALIQGNLSELEELVQSQQSSKHGLPLDAVSMAAFAGQDSMIVWLLEKGLDINQKGPFGNPLRVASLMGHESTVQLLLNRDASLNINDGFGTELQAAAMQGHASITKLLIKNGADVNKEGGFYGPALQAAAYRGHKEVVETLLDAHADMHRTGFSRDAFHAAAEAGHVNIVRLFLERGFRYFDPFGGSNFCTWGPQLRYVDPLLSSSPSRVSKDKGKAECEVNDSKSPDWKFRATTSDYASMVKVIEGSQVTFPIEFDEPYDHRPSRRDQANYAIEAAAAKGYVHVVKLLLDHWESINIKDHDIGAALEKAAQGGNEAIVQLFTQSKLDLMPHMQTAIESSATNGHLIILDVLSDYVESFSVDRNRRCGNTTQTLSVRIFFRQDRH